MNWQNLSQNAIQRSNVYGLLSSVYSQEPNQTFIEYLLHNKSTLFPLVRGGIWDKKFWSQSVQKICEDLAVEYTLLFIGPKNHFPPFESLYNFNEGEIKQIWGDATVEVKRIIDGSGLSFKEDYGGIPDHVGIELEFMQKLVNEEAQLWDRRKNDSLKKTIEIERKFLVEHLGKWIPCFCGEVIEVAKLDFYRNFAALTEDFIENEIDEVDYLLSHIK